MSRYKAEATECKVYIGDLPRDAEEREIERSFSHYGPLKSVWVAHNPPGFAFVEFEDVRDAEDAVRALDGATICGVRARVEHATGKVRPKPWNRRGGGSGGGSERGGGGPPQSRYGGRDGGRDSGAGGGPSRRSFDPNDRCFVCGERGHYSYDCPKSGGGRGGSGGGGGGASKRKRSTSRSRSRSHGRKTSNSRSVSRSRSRDRSARRSASRDAY